MNNSLEAIVGRLLKTRRLTVATAESCTGGLIAHRLTNVPGSSAYVKGAVVAYSNEAKERLLGVPGATLQQHGAVSAATAIEMARGARRLFSADIALAVTGIAGPDGGTVEKPVGLTHVALSATAFETVDRFVWPYDRLGNKDASADAALRMLESFLVGAHDDDVARWAAVESDLLSDGTVRPRSFIWEGTTRTVADTGRQWLESGTGGQRRHVLVMDDSGEVFELILHVATLQWTAQPTGRKSLAA